MTSILSLSEKSIKVNGILIHGRFCKTTLFRNRLVDLDWRLVCVDYVLFHLATIEDGIDHVAHAGGFLFGYLIHDIVLYQKHLF